jgi:hypothetical protein
MKEINRTHFYIVIAVCFIVVLLIVERLNFERQVMNTAKAYIVNQARVVYKDKYFIMTGDREVTIDLKAVGKKAFPLVIKKLNEANKQGVFFK